MGDSRTTPLTILLPKTCRDSLRKQAAERNVTYPEQVLTVAGIVREIVINYLKDSKEKEKKPVRRKRMRKTKR